MRPLFHVPPGLSMSKSRRSSQGLTGLTYQILLALAEIKQHGYGILKEMEERGGPSAVPSTGALYLALQRMESQGLIAGAPAPESPAADARRRYYRITEQGRDVASEESRRLAVLVSTARDRALLGEPLAPKHGKA